MPSVLAWEPTLDDALRVQSALSARKHGVLVIDPTKVTRTADMARVRRFTIGSDRFQPNDRDAPIAFTNIAALVRAVTTTAVLRKTSELQPAYGGSVGRPPAMEVREHVTHESTEANLLYVCPAEGAPMLMVQHEAKYLSLGAAMRVTEHDNFLTTIELLRKAAPHAYYDDRFAGRAHDSRQLAIARGSDRVEAKGDVALDLLVHALVRWLTRGSGSPYRDD